MIPSLRSSLKSVRCLLALAAAIVCLPSAFAQTIYTVGSDGSFGSFSLSSFVYTRITANSLAGYENLTPTGAGAFYSTTATSNLSNSISQVSVNGVVSNTVGGNISALSGLARSPLGTLYGVSHISQTLVTIFPSNGAQSTVGGLNANTVENTGGDIAFVGNTLYAIGIQNSDNSASLDTINPFTGSELPGPGNNGLRTLTPFSVGTTLYAVNASGVYRLDPNTAALTQLGALTGANLPASFVGASVVPEPSTWALLGAGTGILGLTLRRRSLQA